METQGPELDYLDTKFEQFWEGDESQGAQAHSRRCQSHSILR